MRPNVEIWFMYEIGSVNANLPKTFLIKLLKKSVTKKLIEYVYLKIERVGSESISRIK